MSLKSKVALLSAADVCLRCLELVQWACVSRYISDLKDLRYVAMTLRSNHLDSTGVLHFINYLTFKTRPDVLGYYTKWTWNLLSRMCFLSFTGRTDRLYKSHIKSTWIPCLTYKLFSTLIIFIIKIATSNCTLHIRLWGETACFYFQCLIC